MMLTVYTVFLYFTFRKWLVESPSDPNVMAFNPRYEHAIYTSCIVISLYINAFIAYEIYVLLKNSKMRRHTNPPTFKKVLCECGIAYTPGVIVFIVDKVLRDRLRQRDQTGDTTLGLCYIFYVAIPISFLLCICFQIWYNKLLPAKSMNLYGGRLRILALYFGRIVFVKLLVWLPAIIMFGSYSFQNRLYHAQGLKRAKFSYSVAVMLNYIQVTISFCMTLTKRDARKLITDFITVQYCCCCCCCNFNFNCCQWRRPSNESQEDDDEEEEPQEDDLVDNAAVEVYNQLAVVGHEITSELTTSIRSDSFLQLDCDIHRSSFNISLPLQHPPTDSTS
jgi:hypothetical protein